MSETVEHIYTTIDLEKDETPFWVSVRGEIKTKNISGLQVTQTNVPKATYIGIVGGKVQKAVPPNLSEYEQVKKVAEAIDFLLNLPGHRYLLKRG